MLTNEKIQYFIQEDSLEPGKSKKEIKIIIPDTDEAHQFMSMIKESLHLCRISLIDLPSWKNFWKSVEDEITEKIPEAEQHKYIKQMQKNQIGIIRRLQFFVGQSLFSNFLTLLVKEHQWSYSRAANQSKAIMQIMQHFSLNEGRDIPFADSLETCFATLPHIYNVAVAGILRRKYHANKIKELTQSLERMIEDIKTKYEDQLILDSNTINVIENEMLASIVARLEVHFQEEEWTKKYKLTDYVNYLNENSSHYNYYRIIGLVLQHIYLKFPQTKPSDLSPLEKLKFTKNAAYEELQLSLSKIETSQTDKQLFLECRKFLEQIKNLTIKDLCDLQYNFWKLSKIKLTEEKYEQTIYNSLGNQITPILQQFKCINFNICEKIKPNISSNDIITECVNYFPNDKELLDPDQCSKVILLDNLFQLAIILPNEEICELLGRFSTITNAILIKSDVLSGMQQKINAKNDAEQSILKEKKRHNLSISEEKEITNSNENIQEINKKINLLTKEYEDNLKKWQHNLNFSVLIRQLEFLENICISYIEKNIHVDSYKNRIQFIQNSLIEIGDIQKKQGAYETTKNIIKKLMDDIKDSPINFNIEQNKNNGFFDKVKTFLHGSTSSNKDILLEELYCIVQYHYPDLLKEKPRKYAR